MLKKILVATDGSEYSRRAFKTALELANAVKTEIILLNVRFTPEPLGYKLSNGSTVPQDQSNITGEQALSATLAGIDTSDILIKKKEKPGSPAQVILEEIENEDIDLVVMGSRGYGAITGALLGSVSQRVLQRAGCPVLIVK